jgi:tetratricopeptide (TPR) repeat protein
MKKGPIKIISGFRKDFSKKVNLAGETYLIDSEDFGINNPVIVTRIFHKGKIVSSHEVAYKDILDKPDLDGRLAELINRQQQQAMKALKFEKVMKNRTYGDYIQEVEALIKRNNQKEALKLLTDALEHYPSNPFIWSYQGYLEAVVNKKYSKGVNTCRHAFKILKEQVPLGDEFFSPILYLNLGKAYLAASKRKEAYASFQKGLEIDKENRALMNELKIVGIRRQPFLPFLKRSNPLNKYLGKLTSSLKGN